MTNDRPAAGRKPGGEGKYAPCVSRRARDDRDRARFARAVARTELGRHYWCKTREADFQVARRKKPKLKK